MATIILSTHGSNGDVLPFLALGRTLRSRGHRVTLLTHGYYAPAAARTGVDFVEIDTVDEYTQHLRDAQALLEQQRGFDPAALLEFFRRNDLFARMRREFTTILNRHVPGNTVVVGRHTSGLSTLMAAEALSVPAVWVAVTPSQCLAMPMTEAVHAQVLAEPINALRREVGLPAVSDWAAWLSSASGHIGLWPDWFDEAGPRTPVRRVGFVLGDDADTGLIPAEAADMLAGHPAPVLIACTTGQMQRATFHDGAARAAAALGRPALLVSQHRDFVAAALPDGIRWFERLPFRDVMPRVAAVIHQGGIGTAARAVASATPQLILPFTFDQPDNAARLSRLGHAQWLPQARWTVERITDRLATVLDATRRPGTPLVGDPAAALNAAAELIEAELDRGERGAVPPLRLATV